MAEQGSKSTGNRVGLPSKSCGCVSEPMTGMLPMPNPAGNDATVQPYAEQPASGVEANDLGPKNFKGNDGCAAP